MERNPKTGSLIILRLLAILYLYHDLSHALIAYATMRAGEIGYKDTTKIAYMQIFFLFSLQTSQNSDEKCTEHEYRHLFVEIF